MTEDFRQDPAKNRKRTKEEMDVGAVGSSPQSLEISSKVRRLLLGVGAPLGTAVVPQFGD